MLGQCLGAKKRVGFTSKKRIDTVILSADLKRALFVKLLKKLCKFLIFVYHIPYMNIPHL